MRLRIISGELGGRFITLRDNENAFRPTQERVRQSVAEILKNVVQGAIVADVCAGSGAFGFEMISRGAVAVDFIEKDRQRARKINENAESLGCVQKCTVYPRDLLIFLKSSIRRYDIIYFDPPYDTLDSDIIVAGLARLLSANGILIFEHRRDTANRENLYPQLRLYDSREYGETVIDFFQNTFSQTF